MGDWLKLELVRNHKIDILVILAVFLLGFGARMIPSETFPGIYGFDSFYHARMVRTLLQTGYIPEKDPVSYWPEHAPYKTSYPPFYHYTLAGWYSWIKLLATGSTGYDENLFVPINNSASAFYGGLAVVAMYLLGLAVRNRKAGLFSALIFLGGTSFFFRTIYGFTEEDPAGIFFYTLTLALFAWALKKGKPKYGWLAGLGFGLFMITWRMAIFPAAVIATFTILEMAIDVWNKNFNDLEGKTEVLLMSLVPMVILDLAYDTVFHIGFMSLFFLGTATVLGILANYFFNYRNLKNKKADLYKYASILALLALVVILTVKFDFIYNTTYTLLFKAPVESSKLSLTVGEEHPATLSGVIHEMGWLTPLFLIGLVWLPIRRVIKRNERTSDLLIWILAAATFYLYINKAKMGYIFDTPEALLVGVVIADIFALADWIKEKSKGVDTRPIKAIAMIIGLSLAIISVSKGIILAEQYKTSYSPQTGWIKAYDYLTSQPDHDKYVLMTWWDYGHWSAWWGLKTTLDNTNHNPKKVMETARIFTDFRGNTTDEILKKHEDELKKWQVTHIGVDRIVITCQKWGALTFLGDNVWIPLNEAKKWGLPTQGLVYRVGNAPMVYAGCMQGVYCRQAYDNNGNPKIVCPISKNFRLEFTPNEWARMVNTRWPGYDLSVDTGQGIFKARVYARPDGYLMFFVNRQGQIVPDAPANYMLGYRLFFQDPSIKSLNLVGDFWGLLKGKYRYVPEEEVVFWRVNYDKLDKIKLEANETSTT